MSKPFYADYVNRMLRFYVREVVVTFETETDRLNWKCVHGVLKRLKEDDKRIILNVYQRFDTFSDNVYEVSRELNINQDIIWTLVSRVTKEIAKERGLI